MVKLQQEKEAMVLLQGFAVEEEAGEEEKIGGEEGEGEVVMEVVDLSADDDKDRNEKRESDKGESGMMNGSGTVQKSQTRKGKETRRSSSSSSGTRSSSSSSSSSSSAAAVAVAIGMAFPSTAIPSPTPTANEANDEGNAEAAEEETAEDPSRSYNPNRNLSSLFNPFMYTPSHTHHHNPPPLALILTPLINASLPAPFMDLDFHNKAPAPIARSTDRLTKMTRAWGWQEKDGGNEPAEIIVMC